MTMQAGEELIYKGEKHWTYNQPLEPYLKQHKDIVFAMFTTAHWRGYQGKWEIKDNKLFIVGIQSSNYTFENIFKTSEPVFANWYSGKIKIGIGEEKCNAYMMYHDKYLALDIVNGKIIKKQIIVEIYDEQVFDFGKYKGKTIKSVIAGKLSGGDLKTLKYYLEDLISFFSNSNFKQKVLSPYFKVEEADIKLVESMKYSGIENFLTPTYIALSRRVFYKTLEEDEKAEMLSGLLQRVLSSDFSVMMVLKKKEAPDEIITENSVLLNPDTQYIIWAIKEVDSFCIPPMDFNRSFKRSILKTFNINRLNSTAFEYTPVLVQEQFEFPEEIKLLNEKKFREKYKLVYNKEEDCYLLDMPQSNIFEEYRFYLDDSIKSVHDLHKKNYSDNEKEDIGRNYQSSYEKYGGYNDWDDDAIDYGFEGDPSNTWNVD